MKKANYQNTQLYMECRLVSIWNSAIFFNMSKKVPQIGTKWYEKMCEKFHCKNGSCLGVGKELKRLRLKMVEGKWDYNWIKHNLPVELSVYPPNQRAHSILAIEEKFGGFEVTNMSGGVLQWYSYDKLYELRINNPHFLPQSIKKKKRFFHKTKYHPHPSEHG